MENVLKIQINIEMAVLTSQAPEIWANITRLVGSQENEPPTLVERPLANWRSSDVEKALQVYTKLTEDTRKVFDLWMDHPGKAYSLAEIAAATGMENGVAGARGALSFPKKYCTEVGRTVVYDTDSQERKHGMNEETAAAFVAARDAYLIARDI